MTQLETAKKLLQRAYKHLDDSTASVVLMGEITDFINEPVETTNEQPKLIPLNYNTVERVKKVIMKILGCNSAEIEENISVHELGADSLEHVEIIMNLEREFNTAIDDYWAEKMLTLRLMVEYLQKEKG